MVKAFAYLRVSGKGQLDGDGFDRQLEAIRNYAKANEIRIKTVFREEGVSGTKDLADRPAFMAMLSELLSNGVRVVIIEKLDRLARDLMVQETIIGEMRKNGITLISVHEPDLLQDDPSRKLVRQIFGAIAEYERAMIVAKLRGARMRKKAKEGRCEGAKPYGFYQGESEILERMQTLRAEGLSFDGVAAKLNAKGLKPRKAEAWTGWGINVILTRSEAS
jgi:DNA invertase Pin-like site-specific DNA recombinase